MTLSAQEFRKRHRTNALHQPLEKAQSLFRALRDTHASDRFGGASSGDTPSVNTVSSASTATSTPVSPGTSGDGATLFVGTGPGIELALALSGDSTEQSWTIGGLADADHAIPEPALKGLSFTIRFRDGCWFVVNDCNSLHLYVNGEPVRIAVLEHGDELHAGNLTIKFAQHLTRSLKLV